jgi:hypothetical protein
MMINYTKRLSLSFIHETKHVITFKQRLRNFKSHGHIILK